MCHSLPGPLSPRCFPILVLTAYTSATSFLAVTVPIDLSSSSSPSSSPTTTTKTPESAYYTTGTNTTDPTASHQQRKKPVLGVYAAVETVRIMPDHDDDDGDSGGEGGKRVGVGGKVEWIMATASDTKGNLPMFLQKPNLPAAVAKDVGFFIGWIQGVDVQ